MTQLKSLLLFFLIISGLVTTAQPVFTYAAFAPHIGDQYTTGYSSFTYTGSVGPNQTWNFSTAQMFSTATYTVVPASATPVSTNYPNATEATFNGGGYLMLDVSTSEYLNYGATITPGTPGYIYTDPQKLFEFPMSYGNTFTDVYQGPDYNSPDYRIGTTTVTYEGYGTVITPFNTFTNALCIHCNYTDVDTASNGQNSCTGDMYYWFATGYRYPVVQCWYQPSTSTCGGQSSGSIFLQSITIGYEEQILSGSAIQISPNPFSSDVKINNPNGKEGDLITLSDITGRTVRTIPFYAEQMEIDLSDLENGVYMVSLNNGMATKIVKSGR